MSEKVRNWIGHGLVLLVFLVAVWMLLHELKDPDGKQYSAQVILQRLKSISTGQLLWALALTVFSYVVLFGYDVLALQSIGRSLPLWRVAIAAFVGHCCSFNFGAILGGSTVRYRLYSLWGLSAVDIVKLLLVLGVTFWVGALALAGAMFWWQPIHIPEKLQEAFAKFHLTFTSVQPLAPILIGIVILYLGLSFFNRRPLRIKGHELHLPSLRMAISQLIVASADFVVAASVLYVLLPKSVEISFAQFLSIYLLAIVGGVATHVPGGVGILELVVLSLVTSSQQAPVEKDALFASLLAFRVVYYLLPLFPALALLGAADVLTPQKHKASSPPASH
ncbi:MAG: UPF0104 family protein [Planctomycetes bacterium]|nr:UPF0104 family protein [Planctomycetota bacterium]